jgi:hypothetical protein
MTIYPPPEGFTAEEMRRGLWVLYVDVKCSNSECGKEYSAAQVGGIGGSCLRCGSRCR